MRVTRRGLFGVVLGALVGARVAPSALASWGGYTAADITPLDAAEFSAVGGINRATFSFWRNQQVGASSFDALQKSMREIYNSAGRHCPNCGAPAHGGACVYCGTPALMN